MGILEIIIGKQDVMDGVKAVLGVLSPAGSELIEKILQAWYFLAQQLAPRKTGELADTHIYELEGPYAGFMGPTVSYAPFVINPTRAHIICPAVAKSLYWPELGHPLPPGRCVQHPGTPGNDYLETVDLTSTDAVDQYADEYLDKLEQAWGG